MLQAIIQQVNDNKKRMVNWGGWEQGGDVDQSEALDRNSTNYSQFRRFP